MEKSKVFLSHPFAEDPHLNWVRIQAAIKVLEKRFPDVLFLSPLHMFSYFREESPEFREPIMEVCKELISISDEVWILGISAGCLREAEWALAYSKSIWVNGKYWNSGLDGNLIEYLQSQEQTYLDVL